VVVVVVVGRNKKDKDAESIVATLTAEAAENALI